jgi:hypothetical protein
MNDEEYWFNYGFNELYYELLEKEIEAQEKAQDALIPRVTHIHWETP